jgi:hypothetical protein
MSYNPLSFWHRETKQRLKNEAQQNMSRLNINLSKAQRINLNRKYSENPSEYQKYLSRLSQGSRILTKEESNNLEKKRQENQMKQLKEQEEILKQMEATRRKGMNKGEIYKIDVFEPAKKSLSEKLNISQNDLNFPTVFIPKFSQYIKNSNINSKIKDMYNYTKIWKEQQEYDNLKSGEEDIPYIFMKHIWGFQETFRAFK